MNQKDKAPPISDEWKSGRKPKNRTKKTFRIEYYAEKTFYRKESGWVNWYASYATEKDRDQALLALNKSHRVVNWKFRAKKD